MPILVESVGGNPATIFDLESRWRPLSEQEAINAGAFLADAWGHILGRRPNLEADITAGTVSTANVTRVVCASVLRVLKNIEGWEEESQDDWRGKRNELLASGELFLTTTEWADITPGRKSRRSVRLVSYGDE